MTKQIMRGAAGKTAPENKAVSPAEGKAPDWRKCVVPGAIVVPGRTVTLTVGQEYDFNAEIAPGIRLGDQVRQDCFEGGRE